MPYYLRSWNDVLSDEPLMPSKPLRTYPATEFAQKQDCLLEPPLREKRVNATKVRAFQAQLGHRVSDILATKGAEPLKTDDSMPNVADSYQIDRSDILWRGQHSTVYNCGNGESKLIARYFVPSSMLKPDDLYLKILRYIDKKHPNIIHTLDIFLDQKQHIILLQECGNVGSLLEYLRSGKRVSEEQMGSWTLALYAALDWLGDNGIAHRSIHPRHLLLKASGQSAIIKLSGFRDAILYWDPTTCDIFDQPCNTRVSFASMYFNAPEMFGNEGEYYNPVDADIWSFGACLFFSVSRIYPFNVKKPAEDLEGEIRKTVALCESLSDGAKYFLFGLMRTHTKMRTQFDAIKKDSWFLKQTCPKPSFC